MAFQAFPLITKLGTKIIDRVWPDPEDRAKAQLELMRLNQTKDLAELDAEVKLMLGQLEVNKIEAQSNHWWQHWRPAAGWLCVGALAWHFIIERIWIWLATLYEIAAPPNMDVAQLITVLLAMLGVGTMRSVDKRTRSKERQKLGEK